MKKFLSILLAVMMVLSTVSFAVPSVAGTSETAVEVPVVEENAVEAEAAAELAADVALTDNQHGRLIVNVDFENPSTESIFNAWPQAGRAFGAQTNYVNGENMTFSLSGDNPDIVPDWCPATATNVIPTEDGNKYLHTIQKAGYNDISLYNLTGPNKPIDGTGVYTLIMDVRYSDPSAVSEIFPRFYQSIVVDGANKAQDTGNYWTQKVSVKGEGWQTYTFVADTSEVGEPWTNGLASVQFFTLTTADINIDFDNVKLYYRPATVKVTVEGEEYEVKTGGVSVNEIAAFVKAPTGYAVTALKNENGDILTGTQYFLEDCTLYPVYEKDVNLHDTYGKRIAYITFDGKTYAPSLQSSEYDTFTIKQVAASYDATKILDTDNFQIALAGCSNPTFVDGKYTGSVIKAWNAPFTLVKDNGSGEWGTGYYTLAFDLKTDVNTGFAISQSTSSFKTLDAYNFTGEPDHVVLAINKDYLTKANTSHANSVQLQFNAAASFEVDNIELFWKPDTANVTLIAGGNEYTVENVSTNGVTAESLLTAAGVYIPTGKKAVLSAFEGGESVGDVVYLATDSTFYVNFEEDSSINEKFGKRVFLIDYEKDGIAVQTAANATSKLDAMTDNYNPNFDISNVYQFFTDASSVSLKTEAGNSYVEMVSGGAYNFAQLYKHGMDWPRGIYTILADIKVSESHNGLANHINGYNDYATLDKPLNPNNTSWQTVQTTLNYSDSYSTPGGHTTWNSSYYAVNIAAGATIAFDNYEVYYKPATADVTFVYGGNEYTLENLSTATGHSVSDLLAQAGIKTPYAKVPAFATLEGETPEKMAELYLIGDSKYYVTFVDDENITAYGKALFVVDFEQFEEGYSVAGIDNLAISNYTDNYDPAFKTTKINWEVGTATVTKDATHDSKYIRGGQGYSQIRINNPDYANAPAGIYTFALETVNFGTTEAAFGPTTQGSVKPTCYAYDTYVGTVGVWDTVSAVFEGPADDFTLYYNAKVDVVGDVGFDNVALYYRPTTVDLTIVNGTEETVYNDINATISISELLKDVYVPYGYKASLSAEVDGEPISRKDTVDLVSDATLYVVNVADEAVDFDYGTKVLEYDFEGIVFEAGHNNGTYASYPTRQYTSYYNEKYVSGTDDFLQFYIPYTGAPELITEDDNSYIKFYTNNNYDAINLINSTDKWLEGTYILSFDVCTATATGFAITQSGSSFKMIDDYSFSEGEFDRVVIKINKDWQKDKNSIQLQFVYAQSQILLDNLTLYYIPSTAKLDVVANGQVVKTLTNLDTDAEVAVATMLEGVKVKGYDIAGVSYGGKTYTAEESIKVLADCSVDLVLVEREQSAATPETSAENNMRVADPVGMRFKASVSKDAAPVEFGWIVTRASLLEGAGIDAADFTKESSVTKVQGKNFSTAENIEKIFEQDDAEYIFTAVLYFANTEDDGVPSVEKLTDYMIARPYAIDADGEYVYGAPTEPISVFDVCMKVWNNEEGEAWNSLSADEQDKIYAIMDKCDTDQDGVADIFQK